MPRFRIEGSVCVWAVICIFILPLRCLIAMILATAVHEFGHYILLRLMKVPVFQIRIGAGGMVMESGAMTSGEELLCALGGPAAGLILLFFARWLPMTALLAAAQSIFNLLPVYPLDGGRILHAAASILFGEHRRWVICHFVERVAVLCLVILCAAGTFLLKLGIIPLVLAALLVVKVVSRKIPCKTGPLAVQ